MGQILPLQNAISLKALHKCFTLHGLKKNWVYFVHRKVGHGHGTINAALTMENNKYSIKNEYITRSTEKHSFGASSTK